MERRRPAVEIPHRGEAAGAPAGGFTGQGGPAQAGQDIQAPEQIHRGVAGDAGIEHESTRKCLAPGTGSCDQIPQGDEGDTGFPARRAKELRSKPAKGRPGEAGDGAALAEGAPRRGGLFSRPA